MAARICLIWAQDLNGAIGHKNGLLFSLKEDMRTFKAKTKGGVVVMGRKTYTSLPFAAGLPDRYNVVVSRDPEFYVADSLFVEVVNDFDAYMKRQQVSGNTLWVIGGAEIYQQAMKYATELHVTHVYTNEPHVDAYAPKIDDQYWGEVESTAVHVDDKTTLSYCISIYKPKKKILHLKKK